MGMLYLLMVVSLVFLALIFYFFSFLVPDFEMKVPPGQAEFVKAVGGLVYYSDHDDNTCVDRGFVVPASQAGSVLPTQFSYTCINKRFSYCPNMEIDYVDDSTVFVSGIHVNREDYHFDAIKSCVESVVLAGELIKYQVDLKEVNLRSYGDL